MSEKVGTTLERREVRPLSLFDDLRQEMESFFKGAGWNAGPHGFILDMPGMRPNRCKHDGSEDQQRRKYQEGSPHRSAR